MGLVFQMKFRIHDIPPRIYNVAHKHTKVIKVKTIYIYIYDLGCVCTVLKSTSARN